MPKVSVIMSALNAEKYIKLTIESILNQSLKDIELIMVDDGSTDNTLSIMKQFERENVQIIVNEQNLGIAASLNKAMKQAKGDYIAKMDADDISALSRLKKQSDFLDKHQNVVAVGTSAYHINSDGEVTSAHQQPLENNALQFALYFHYPFYNSSLMLRRAILRKYNITHEEKFRSAAEDYAFVTKIAPHGELANLSEALQFFRKHEASTCGQNLDKQLKNNAIISQYRIVNKLGSTCAPEEIEKILFSIHSNAVECKDFLKIVKLADVLASNNVTQEAVKQVMGVIFLKILLNNKKLLLDPSIALQVVFNKKLGVITTLRYKNRIRKWQKKAMNNIPE